MPAVPPTWGTLLRTLRLLALLLVPACLGCGLSDYEQHMLESQARLARLEEQARLLGEPLELPRRPKVNPEDVEQPDLFFRPPRGLDKSPANADKPLGGKPPKQSGFLYHYARPTANNPPPGGKPAGANPGLTDLYVALVTDRPETGFKIFIDDVMRIFPHISTSVVERPREYTFPDGRKLHYDTVEFSDGKADYFACFADFSKTDKAMFAAVFRAEKGTLPSLTAAIDASLKTLGVGEAAGPLRNQYGEELGRVPPLRK
jgi:hypothetical protein